MTLRLTGVVCVALVAVGSLAGGASAQTTATTTAATDYTQEWIAVIQSLLGGSASSSALSSLLSSLAATSGTSGTSSTTATSQPSGSPSTFIAFGVAEHNQFYANAFGKTPAQRRAAASQPAATTKIPISLIIPALAKWLGANIPALSFLSNLFGNSTTTPGTGAIPPASLSGKGPVAFVTADSTSLTVGGTTTGRVWVQQSSPNSANNNGIFSVAVDIDAAPAGVVKAEVPVTILSTWSNPAVAASTGTANTAGGIDEVTAGVDITKNDKTEGISGPVEVFDFTITGVAAGTVTLKALNFTTNGFQGLLDYASQTGDEANYVSVDITVTP